MTSCYVTIMGRELHYMRWEAEQVTHGPQGSEQEKPKLLICWHGLTRTCRDFDEVCRRMSSAHRRPGYLCIAPDTIGRGLSEWADEETYEKEYNTPFYAQLAVKLVQHLGYDECDWLGTSMGGLIAYTALAMGPENGGFARRSTEPTTSSTTATPQQPHLRRLILNDIGPEIHAPGLQRIFGYTSEFPEFNRYSEFEKHYQEANFKDFGPCSDEFVRRTLEAYVRRMPGPKGTFRAHYDPRIIEVIKKALGPLLGGGGGGEAKKEENSDAPPKPDVWAPWQFVNCETLIFRGEVSDLLVAEASQKMISTHKYLPLVATESGTVMKPEEIEAEKGTVFCFEHVVPQVGHAPSLTSDVELNVIDTFFNRGGAAL